jgi:hypothetical protein
MNVQAEYDKLMSEYWNELKKADARGKYNAVFKTYSTSQRDVQTKYKNLFSTIQAIAERKGIELAEIPAVEVEAPKDEVLG